MSMREVEMAQAPKPAAPPARDNLPARGPVREPERPAGAAQDQQRDEQDEHARTYARALVASWKRGALLDGGEGWDRLLHPQYPG